MEPQNVRDVLNRRSDLSTFVVHLTKDGIGEETAKKRLESIIQDQRIEARSRMGFAASDGPSEVDGLETQRVVSFTETPLEHIYSHVAEIKGRQEKFKPYGIALTKLAARRAGVNPVWYVDQTPGRDWEISAALNELKEQAIDSGDFGNQPIARVLPFVEQMGTWPTTGRQKEFWWEREWRNRGDFWLPSSLVGCLVLCPENELDHFEKVIAPGTTSQQRMRRKARCIDPRWGLEQIIAHLAGIPDDLVTPFGPEEEAGTSESLSGER